MSSMRENCYFLQSHDATLTHSPSQRLAFLRADDPGVEYGVRLTPISNALRTLILLPNSFIFHAWRTFHSKKIDDFQKDGKCADFFCEVSCWHRKVTFRTAIRTSEFLDLHFLSWTQIFGSLFGQSNGLSPPY